jgi:hypothetical protein
VSEVAPPAEGADAATEADPEPAVAALSSFLQALCVRANAGTTTATAKKIRFIVVSPFPFAATEAIRD